MPTDIYESTVVYTIDDRELYITPLKVKYLKLVMERFEDMNDVNDDIGAINVLAQCALIGMKQYMPEIKTIDDLEDNFNMDAVYKILDVGAGIKVNGESSEESIKDQAEKSSENSWETLDLAKLESELFLLGIWKDYEELETSLSMPEITATLNAKRDFDYQDKKFSAALQGVDLDEENGNSEKEVNPWEAMKARVFSGGATSDPNNILSYQGIKAQQAGFGIGMGLDYEDQTQKN